MQRLYILCSITVRRNSAKAFCRLWCKHLHTMWNWFNTNHFTRLQSSHLSRYRRRARRQPIKRRPLDFLGRRRRRQHSDHRPPRRHGGITSRQRHSTNQDIIHRRDHHMRPHFMGHRNRQGIVRPILIDHIGQHRLVFCHCWAFQIIPISITICTDRKRWKRKSVKSSVWRNSVATKHQTFAFFLFSFPQAINISIIYLLIYCKTSKMNRTNCQLNWILIMWTHSGKSTTISTNVFDSQPWPDHKRVKSVFHPRGRMYCSSCAMICWNVKQNCWICKNFR